MDKANMERLLSEKGVEILQDSARIRDAWTQAKDRADKIPTDTDNGKEAYANIKTMLSLLQDYLKGDYQDISKHSLAVLIGTIAYCALPIDLIPDPIPAIGLSDDVALIIFAASTLLADIITYRNWKAAQEDSESAISKYLDDTVGDDPILRQQETNRLAEEYGSVSTSSAVKQERDREVSVT